MNPALTRGLIRLLERLGWSWTVRCDACDRPGRRGTRAEIIRLVDVHNGLVHRGHPVAAARLAGARLAGVTR